MGEIPIESFGERPDVFALMLCIAILATLMWWCVPTREGVYVGFVNVKEVPAVNGTYVILHSAFPKTLNVYVVGSGGTAFTVLLPNSTVMVRVKGIPRSIAFYFGTSKLIEKFRCGVYVIKFRMGVRGDEP